MTREPSFSSAAFGLVSLVALGGCTVQTLPAPAAPAPSMPVLAAPLPEARPGTARVIVATDVPARVIGRRRKGDGSGGFGGEEVWNEQVVCARTPCVVTVPYGEHAFRFEGVDDGGRSSSAKLTVDRDTIVVNHTLGQSRFDWARPVGLGLLTLGIASLLVVGGNFETGGLSPKVGNALVLGGLGGVVVGGLTLAASGSPSSQEGSTTQWTPSPATAKVGASLAGTF
jgi:hypothetical protein